MGIAHSPRCCLVYEEQLGFHRSSLADEETFGFPHLQLVARWLSTPEKCPVRPRMSSASFLCMLTLLPVCRELSFQVGDPVHVRGGYVSVRVCADWA
jgi:hypothetical protein